MKKYTGPERRESDDYLQFGFAPLRIEGGYNYDPLRGGRERRRDSSLYAAEEWTEDDPKR